MKRPLIFLILISGILKTNAQGTMPLDTLYANDKKNVALFFPEPIRQGITGSDHFVFTYNRDKQQYFGLLQAKPGADSNLLVVNNDGSVFSFIIQYKERLEKLNYFIPQANSIGNEKPVAVKTEGLADPEKPLENRIYHYQKFSAYLLERKQRIGRIKERNADIVLRVENIVFDREELYFLIRIENRSTLDYDLNFLGFSTQTRQKGKNSSLQNLPLEPLFVFGLPHKIPENQTSRFVYVMPKFSLGNDRRVLLELLEQNGERDLTLKVSHKFINNPN